MVAFVGHTENKIGSNLSAMSSGLHQLPQEEHRGFPQDGSALGFSYKSILESCSGKSDILNQEYLDFLVKHVQAKSRETYISVGASSKDSVREKFLSTTGFIAFHCKVNLPHVQD